MVQNYIVDKLTLSDIKENGKLVIPSFQRGLVWTKQHRKDFIETVKSGDPFGVVLVSQAAPGEPYRLIDGLQRLSTLKAYMDQPLEFIDENDKFIDKSLLDKIFLEKYKSMGISMPSEQKLSKEKKAFLKKFISYLKKESNIPDAVRCWPQMAAYLGVDVGEYAVLSSFSEFYRSFVDNLQLPDIIIHAIVYQGPTDRLPSVFETLNTSSVSLTKYEVFSSQWPLNKIIVSDEELIDKVWSKYDGLKKSSSFEVDVTRDSISNSGMTLFEYCFGFSELVCDPEKKYAFLFPKTKKTTEPTGFELLAVACGLSVNRADDLWKDTYLGKSSGLFLVNLKDALIDSISVVASALQQWVYDLKGAPIKNASSYQIYYMIMSVFKHLYQLDLNTKSIARHEDAEWIQRFKKYAYKWYLYHQVQNFWTHNRQVSDLKRLIDDISVSDAYCTNISKSSWEDELNKFFIESKDNFNTRNIPSETKVFLNYYYRLLIQEDANRAKYFKKNDDNGNEIEFDIEHIVPVAKFDHFVDEYSISALGNLCYLPVKDNRSKRDHTIYEYAMDRPALVYNQQFLDMIIYPTREALSFIDCPESQFAQHYELMVKDRESKMITKFVERIVL